VLQAVGCSSGLWSWGETCLADILTWPSIRESGRKEWTVSELIRPTDERPSPTQESARSGVSRI